MGMAHSSPSFRIAHRLVCGHEAEQVLRINPAVTVRNDFKGYGIHPWETALRAVHQVRQLAVITFGQVPPRRANLFLNQIKVVKQPFPGRCYAAIRPDVLCQQGVNVKQNMFISGQALQKAVVVRPGRQLMCARKYLAVLLHLGGTEQLRPQGRFIAEKTMRRVTSAQARAYAAVIVRIVAGLTAMGGFSMYRVPACMS